MRNEKQYEKMRFNIYEDIPLSSNMKILLTMVLVSVLLSFVLFIVSQYIDGKIFMYSMLFLITSIVLFSIYYIKHKSKKFIARHGIIEFSLTGFIVISEGRKSIRSLSEINDVTIVVSSYDGQYKPQLKSAFSDTANGLGNSISITLNDQRKKYNFEVNNRGQLLILKKILIEWKNSNIEVFFTDFENKNLFVDYV